MGSVHLSRRLITWLDHLFVSTFEQLDSLSDHGDLAIQTRMAQWSSLALWGAQKWHILKSDTTKKHGCQVIFVSAVYSIKTLWQWTKWTTQNASDAASEATLRPLSTLPEAQDVCASRCEAGSFKFVVELRGASQQIGTVLVELASFWIWYI